MHPLQPRPPDTFFDGGGTTSLRGSTFRTCACIGSERTLFRTCYPFITFTHITGSSLDPVVPLPPLALLTHGGLFFGLWLSGGSAHRAPGVGVIRRIPPGRLTDRGPGWAMFDPPGALLHPGNVKLGIFGNILSSEIIHNSGITKGEEGSNLLVINRGDAGTWLFCLTNYLLRQCIADKRRLRHLQCFYRFF